MQMTQALALQYTTTPHLQMDAQYERFLQFLNKSSLFIIN